MNPSLPQVPTPLLRLVHAMSGGNPLFTRKFVQALRALGLIAVNDVEVSVPVSRSVLGRLVPVLCGKIVLRSSAWMSDGVRHLHLFVQWEPAAAQSHTQRRSQEIAQ